MTTRDFQRRTGETATAQGQAEKVSLNEVKRLREGARLSQAELAHRVGVSQRHLSCIETGRAQPSREMLTAILDALMPPLSDRNRSMLSFGYAPLYSSRGLNEQTMAEVAQVIDLMLAKHDPFPAIVLDSAWTLVRFNQGVLKLLDLLGLPRALVDGQPNLLELFLHPEGLLSRIDNQQEVMPYLIHRVKSEAAGNPLIQQMLADLPIGQEAAEGKPCNTPVLATRFKTVDGRLISFMTTITTFGTPLDITVESLRIELLFPFDAEARKAFGAD